MRTLILQVVVMWAASFLFAQPRPFTVADDIAMSYFADLYDSSAPAFLISPDKRYCAVITERGLLKQNRPESTLRVYAVRDLDALAASQGERPEPRPVWIVPIASYKDGPIVSEVRWLPNSEGLAFLVKSSLGTDQLVLADILSKTIQPLSRASEHVTGFSLRSKSSFVYTRLSPAVWKKLANAVRPANLVGTGSSLDSLMRLRDPASLARSCDLSELWAVVNGKRFRVVDKESNKPLRVYLTGERALSLSPDGHLLITALPVANVPREWEVRYQGPDRLDAYHIRAGPQDLDASYGGYWYVSEFVVIDLRDGRITSLTDAPIGEAAGWAAMGRGERLPVLTADWSDDNQSVVVANTYLLARERENQQSRPCVAVVNVKSLHAECLEELKKTARGTSEAEDGFHYYESIRFVPGKSDRIAIDYYEPDGTKKSRTFLHSDLGEWTLASTRAGFAADLSSIDIMVRQGISTPPTLVTKDRRTDRVRTILDPNPGFKDIAWGEASIITWDDERGRHWTGGLYKPPSYNPRLRYPLVIQTHGFNASQFNPSGVYPTAFAARELAAEDMVVLQMPYCPLTIDPVEAQCNLSGIKAAVETLVKQGIADPQRLGIVGFSRTCYYVLESLLMPDVHFSAASITDGINVGYIQYISSVDTAGNSYAHEADAIIGARPFGSGLETWLKRSPDFRLSEISTPLQVVAIGRSKLLSMWEPYAALRYLNKPVDLTVLKEGTHVLTNPAERMASQGGTVDWFRFWLQGKEDPDPTKSAQYKRWRSLRRPGD